jgi:hypothetical protein
MPQQHITQVSSSTTCVLGFVLETFEFGQTSCYLQVRRALAAVARQVSEGKVVLGVKSLLSQRIYVVDVELPPLEDQVDWLVAYEAPTRLPRQEPPFKLRSLIRIK